MKYRLAPFCSWRRDGGVIVLETPDHQLKLRPEAEKLLGTLRRGWVEETPVIRALAQYGAVVGNESRELKLLRRLDRYFEDQGIVVHSVRKGSTRPETALPRECYMLKAEPRTKGHGQARGKNLAMLKAAAEVYERLSCDAKVNGELLAPGLDVQALDPGLFVKYKSWQLENPGFPYGEEASGQWAVVREVLTGDPYKVPLELVCYPDRTGSKRVTSVSSNGVACHSSYEAAVLGSAFELIERDALMVHWFWGLSREQIIPPVQLRKRVRRLEALGFRCMFLNLTLELTPVVLVILHREAQKYPRLIMGMASHASACAAMDKALQEVELNVTFYDLDTPNVKQAEDIRGVMDHQFWYDKPENHDEVLSLIGVGKVKVDDIPAGPDTIGDLDDSLRRQNFIWYVTNLNESGRKATGLYVVRSLIGGLTPIAFGYKMEPLGLRRLFQPPTSIECGQPDPSRQTVEGYKIQPFA